MEDTNHTTNSNPEPLTPTPVGHAEPDLPRLRTFADDLSEEIKKKGVTSASIVQAERERAAREVALEQTPVSVIEKYKNPALLITALALVLVGSVGLVGAYFYSTLVPPAIEDTPSIIFPNKITALTVPTYQTLPDTLALERFAVNLPLGEIERIDVTQDGVPTTTVDTLLDALAVPPGLLREARSIMFGVHSFERNQPFIIIEVTQYDRAFGAMLEWEEEIGRSLGNFFRPVGGVVPPTTVFTDKVIQNIDIRVSQKEWPIMYAFPQRDIVVITTNQYTLQEVLTRLSAQNNSTVVR